MNTIDNIRVVLFNPADSNNRLVQKFLSLPGTVHIPYSDQDDLDRCIAACRADGYRSKEVLILKEFRGRFFQKCPGSPRVICCNYLLINTCFNCLYDCMYCYLNVYLNSFGIVQFTNIFDVLDEIDGYLATFDSSSLLRIGTGEYTDSLMMDQTSGIGEAIIRHLARRPEVFLELKTKSDNIDHLLDIPEKGNAVLAWSLNTPWAIDRYESGSAGLDARIAAAARAARAGYFVAFHFDPIIFASEGLDGYRRIINILFEEIPASSIIWISLGGFRYHPAFKEIIGGVFPHEDLTHAEMFPGIDGKFRYLKRRRIDAYKSMVAWIRERSHHPFIYLCMESSDVWNQVFGIRYERSEDLERDFMLFLRKVNENERI